MRGLFCLVMCFVAGVKATVAPPEPIELGMTSHDGKFGTLSDNVEMTDKDKTASANARVSLEKLRLGGIPVLEPYHVAKPLSINVSYEASYKYTYEQKGVIEYDNITVHGLQSFKIQNLEIRLEARKLDFELYFPKLKLDFLYKTSLPLVRQSSGKVNVTMDAVTLMGAYQFAPTDDGHLKIVGMEYYIGTMTRQYNLKDRPQIRPKRYVLALDEIISIADLIEHPTARSIAEMTVKALNTDVLPHYTEAQILKLLIPDKV